MEGFIRWFEFYIEDHGSCVGKGCRDTQGVDGSPHEHGVVELDPFF